MRQVYCTYSLQPRSFNELRVFYAKAKKQLKAPKTGEQIDYTVMKRWCARFGINHKGNKRIVIGDQVQLHLMFIWSYVLHQGDDQDYCDKVLLRGYTLDTWMQERENYNCTLLDELLAFNSRPINECTVVREIIEYLEEEAKFADEDNRSSEPEVAVAA